MPNTYTPIANLTVGVNHPAAPIITFSSIPQGYTDLIMVAHAGTGISTGDDIIVSYFQDGGSTSNYSYVQLGANGNDSNAYSSFVRNANGILAGNLAVGGNAQPHLSASVWNFMNYSATNCFKNVMIRDIEAKRGGLPNASTIGTWRNTAAITSISIRTVNGYGFRGGSTFNLYGVTRA